MAKKGSKKSTKPVSPLYESGTMVGPMAGPKGGVQPRDPFGYLSATGEAPPAGSPGDHAPSSKGERATAH
jgi:hypothetical protein